MMHTLLCVLERCSRHELMRIFDEALEKITLGEQEEILQHLFEPANRNFVNYTILSLLWRSED